jgi:acetylornithine/succinyldiaminopimelate/putrescine aminotransferase
MPRLAQVLGTDVEYERAAGSWLWDRQGRRYLDTLSGFGVFGLGRNHPVVRQALHDALSAELADLVQLDLPLLPGLLAEALLARAPGLDRVYWCSSGNEAIEAALKFARRATGHRRVLYCDHAFHGLTAGALSANGSAEFRRGFGPLLPGSQIPLGDLDALRRELGRGDVAALVVEPIQGKGVHVCPPGFLAAASELLHAHGALLICDEVQTGIGRTGTFLAYQAEDVQPDLVTVAKALSGGYVPVGALLGKEWIFRKVYSSIDRVMVHSSTFGGSALAMVAGLATLAVLDDEALIENARRRGAQLQAGLRELGDRYELLADVRGRGLMVGIEFGPPRSWRLRAPWTAIRTVRKGLFSQLVVSPLFHRHQVISQVSGDHMDVIKFLPPLIVGDEEVGYLLAALDDVLGRIHRGGALSGELTRLARGRARLARSPLPDPPGRG